ncbi:MAG: DsbA family oxidoreductase [Pseudomonadota bacterium]
MTLPALTIDIVSDVVCPWCVIGSRNLATAIEEVRDEIQVDTTWKPFELHPHIAPEGAERKSFTQQKFGDVDAARSRYAQIAEMGKEVGFTFNFGKCPVVPNTFQAHRLMWYAEQQGCQDEISERLFVAFFVDGRNVGDIDELIKIGIEQGLEAEALEAFMRGDEAAKLTRDELTHYREEGIYGVPTFIVNGKYQITGGQTPETFAAWLRKLAAKEASAV